MTEPTDAEIIALADETRTAEGGASGYILPISFARAVLAKWGTPPAVAGEPVMWAYQYSDGSWHDASATEHSAGMKPLYTTPQPTQPQPVAREPLTDEQIRAVEPWIFDTAKQWVRLIEAAHGIKGGQHGADTRSN